MNKWLWHRFRAMSGQEMLLHVRRKLRQRSDTRHLPDFSFSGERRPGAFPARPTAPAPEALLKGLANEARQIMTGKITAFGWLPLKIDTPPIWHKDYLANLEMPTQEKSFRLNHRALPKGADIKLVWELSRWQYLTRLAQTAALLPDKDAGELCTRWLADWAEHNPPFIGWNWTSALESGMRLIQLAWIDGLLPTLLDKKLQPLLPAHIYFTWRYRSFGSSANNHLLGELAGLIIAIARWPKLAHWAASLSELQKLWEKEVLEQFATDGGNKEQALNYHLFSFEFCWQTRAALLAAGHTISSAVEERLKQAIPFFAAVQSESEPWDYGDSDSAFVTPLATNTNDLTREWLGWMKSEASGGSIEFWLGPPPVHAHPVLDWTLFPASGQRTYHSPLWFLRWDVSPLGYLQTAAHGHLDALHVSLWIDGVAMIIDPGTAVYYQDKALRSHLASWEVHNGPCPSGNQWPLRAGPFLWKEHHRQPAIDKEARATLTLPTTKVMRRITTLPDEAGFNIRDRVEGGSGFQVKWHFAPGTRVNEVEPGRFQIERQGAEVFLNLTGKNFQAKLVQPPSEKPAGEFDQWPEPARLTVCSQFFRQITFAPVILVQVGGGEPCVLESTFLASPL